MKSNANTATNAMAQAMLAQRDANTLVELARACDAQGQNWSGWVIEHLAMMNGPWRNDAIVALEPLMMEASSPITDGQAVHLRAIALDNAFGPGLRVLELLKRMGHPAGADPDSAVKCAAMLAQGVWLPPSALVDDLFGGRNGGRHLREFFDFLMRPQDRTLEIDLVQMQRIERAGIFGAAAFIQPFASESVGQRSRDFLHWDDFIETGNFGPGLVWMIEREWVKADLVLEAIEKQKPRILNLDVEGPLLEMITREQARVLQGKMRAETAKAREPVAPGGTRRF